jgi:hypothetical protein
MPIEGDMCSRRNKTLSDGFQMKGTVVGGSTPRHKGSTHGRAHLSWRGLISKGDLGSENDVYVTSG